MKIDIKKIFEQHKNKEKAKNRKSINKFFAFIVYALIFLILIYIFVSGMKSIKAFKYEAFVIVSNSMEPEIKKGDIVIIKESTENEIKEGSIVTFEKDNEYITHRVSKIEDENGVRAYITKGDNNQVEDPEKIYFSQIKGVKIAEIPFIGLLILEIAEQKYIIIILAILVLLYKRAKDIDERSIERRKKKKIEDERIDNKKTD